MTKRSKKQSQEALHIWCALIILLTIGLIMIYSVSSLQYMSSAIHGNDSMYLLKRQLVFVVAGLIVCLVCQYIPYAILYRLAVAAYGISILLILMLKTKLGVSVKGATRWLNVAGIQFQVAEVVKIAVIMMIAYMIQRYHKYLDRVKLTLYIWLLGGGAALLLMKISNDLSSSIVVLGITFGITFIYTKFNRFHIVVIIIVALFAGAYVWNIWIDMPTPEELQNLPFRVGRIAAWLDPERYASDQGYQTLQSLYAIGRGGFWGKGLGKSIQKLQALPEAQNDMIFSIICEELGVLGAVCVILPLFCLCWQMIKIARLANTWFASVMVVGILIHIASQAFINIAVTVNALPNTGIGLPFVSYGGTAVFCQLLEMAIVLSVCKHMNVDRKEER